MKLSNLTNLYGNTAAWQLLINDFSSNKLAHAYLLTGPSGIGKFSMVKEYIKYLLQANEVLIKRIDEGNFPDLLHISKQEKNDITIDMIRKANEFFSQTALEGKYKFVIIDNADDLNRNAANALLKILEEPTKNTHIFLISHAPSKLLPTIRSRCRTIKFQPLNKQDLEQVVGRNKFPELEDFIAGSPGKAIICSELGIDKLYKQLLELIQSDDLIAFNKFADSIIKQPQQWQLLTELLIYLLGNCIKLSTNSSDQEQQNILTKIAETKSTEEWFKLYDQFLLSLGQTEIYNLDKKQLLLLTLYNIRN